MESNMETIDVLYLGSIWTDDGEVQTNFLIQQFII